ncbi:MULTISPECIES: restriction endonuclease PLD domain-containing protein [Bifidobacterium]|uniref:restriction endonuclease PLD domain-containing protein n=1 Tax=Bifidobacterium TaxID=1678 RepID=UPI0012FED8A8|nr:NgoFVII family restriction endonuclease [Bifidobacterium bifidum]MBL3916586.1 NgoFVII family restriction endonuclease [Bifidobacterium longum subsp. suis]MBX9152649.1 NgoFVII family restriction endonuclease [Bifidobacterium longum]QOL38656.1 NgoFVII family restriction endonuclease [Bifidobacterium longum subsp. longum]UNL66828.1 NgoFVII family restriction endonuclease [Bifidobacterium longum subsp. longum]
MTLTIGMYSKEGMPERSYHAARAYNQKWREEGIGEIRLVQTYKRTNVIFGLKKITLVRQWPYPASEPPYIKHFKTNEISEVTKIYISLLQHSTKKTAIYS